MPAAISAQQPLAVEAGAKVLMSGGNAVDAAVTAALMQAVVSPQMCGIGGYAVLNLHLAGQPGSIGIDAPALAGALGFAIAGPRRYDGYTADDDWIGGGRPDLDADDVDAALRLYAAATALLAAVLVAGWLAI